jgi:transcriptional regulator with GAF, ATPase, and Fis domain
MGTVSWASRCEDKSPVGRPWSYPQELQIGRNTIVGCSHAAQRVLEQVDQVAVTNATVLLLGETGTGKELYASHVHQRSTRRNREMVRVNCAAIPSTLIESELFGRERGAYTDAVSRQIGRFELADRSTIFLDEIGDLAPEVQVKLLRVLEGEQIERLGNPKGIRVNVRIIAATHRDLAQRVADGTFREDLFYRLNVFPIQVPPLRERPEDVPLLVWHFVDLLATEYGKTIATISDANMAALQAYSWPGNVRELRNLVERAMIVAHGPELTIPLPATKVSAVVGHTLLDVEKAYIRSVLESTGWRIRGLRGAANRLGLQPTTLESRMAKLGLTRPRSIVTD